MVTVRLFGLLRSGGVKQVETHAGTVGEALAETARQGADPKQLAGALMFVNGKPVHGRKRFSYRLCDGDELALLSPVSGG